MSQEFGVPQYLSKRQTMEPVRKKTKHWARIEFKEFLRQTRVATRLHTAPLDPRVCATSDPEICFHHSTCIPITKSQLLHNQSTCIPITKSQHEAAFNTWKHDGNREMLNAATAVLQQRRDACEQAELVVIEKVFGFNDPDFVYEVDKVEETALTNLMNNVWLEAHYPMASARVCRAEYRTFLVAVHRFTVEVENIILSYVSALTACGHVSKFIRMLMPASEADRRQAREYYRKFTR
jgi:hypothetical protein